MVLTFQDNQWANAIQGLGTVLGQALQQRGQKSQETKILEQLFGAPATSEKMPTIDQEQPIYEGNIVTDKSTAPGIQRISDDQLVALSINPKFKNVASTELKRREIDRKTFESDRKYHAEGAKDAEKRAVGLREALPKKQSALNLAREAIQSGEVGPFSLANLAERTGIKEFQTAKGAQLTTAAKENLLSNMSRVSAKAQNMWFEQRLNSMFPEIGKKMAANEATSIMLQGEIDMDNNWLEAYNQLARNDMEKYGYVRRDADQRASELSNDKNLEIMKKTSYELRKNYEQEKGVRWMAENAKKKVVQGTPLTPEMFVVILEESGGDKNKAIENAKKYGYTIPTQEQIRQWQS